MDADGDVHTVILGGLFNGTFRCIDICADIYDMRHVAAVCREDGFENFVGTRSFGGIVVTVIEIVGVGVEDMHDGVPLFELDFEQLFLRTLILRGKPRAELCGFGCYFLSLDKK
jgi:hypothetical protein